MNKYIEEMAKVMCGKSKPCSLCEVQAPCRCQTDAELLNAEGYRKQPEWISVEERLPEECKNVLCFERNKTMIAFMEKVEDCGEYVPVFWDWVAYDRDDTYDEVCATHWMPLPMPPKGDEGNEKTI